MDVSIVIRTKNEAKYVGDTLIRIQEQEFSGEYEIIVVDSGSTDSTVDIVQRHGVRLLQVPQEEFTYGRSLNIGATEAKGRYIVNLSAHALPRDEKWLISLIAGFEDRRVAGVYGRQLSAGYLNPFEALQNELFFGQKKVTFNMHNSKMLKYIHFSNSNCAIRTDVWEEYKFDEEVPYAEDIMWQTEVMAAGFSIVYIPDAAVYHTHRVSIVNVYKTSRDCAYALALTKKKRRSIALIMVDVGMLFASIPNSLFHNMRYICRNNYHEYLMIAPFYVVCGWLGWLVGRTIYRLKK